MATGIIQSETVKFSVMASASGVICSAEYQAHMAKTPIPARTGEESEAAQLERAEADAEHEGHQDQGADAVADEGDLKHRDFRRDVADRRRHAGEAGAGEDHQEHAFPGAPDGRAPPARSVDCVLMAGGLLPYGRPPGVFLR